MEKAQVKKTGRILYIKSKYAVRNITASFTLDLPITGGSTGIIDETFLWTSPNKKVGDWYSLSDGREYHEGELVIGLDNIRNTNIDKII